jgi:hypothetical protein
MVGAQGLDHHGDLEQIAHRLLRHCERERSNPVACAGSWCFVAVAPRNGDWPGLDYFWSLARDPSLWAVAVLVIFLANVCVFRVCAGVEMPWDTPLAGRHVFEAESDSADAPAKKSLIVINIPPHSQRYLAPQYALDALLCRHRSGRIRDARAPDKLDVAIWCKGDKPFFNGMCPIIRGDFGKGLFLDENARSFDSLADNCRVFSDIFNLENEVEATRCCRGLTTEEIHVSYNQESPLTLYKRVGLNESEGGENQRQSGSYTGGPRDYVVGVFNLSRKVACIAILGASPFTS